MNPNNTPRRVVNFDVRASLLVRAPRNDLDREHFQTFGPYFRPAFRGEHHAANFTAFLAAWLTLELHYDGAEGPDHLYLARLNETVTLQGPSILLPLPQSRVYRETFSWRLRGERYTWTFLLDRAVSLVPGVDISQLTQHHQQAWYQSWEVAFHIDDITNSWIPIRSQPEQ
ncbi:MAG: ORF1 [Yushu Rhabd tick virus 2]|uniref:ORF1 n=1 Tax=Yushu Rhabd tick virus 2 TaxID=2972332 RepID=A0A9E7V2C9_9RHAB|nr:MAG: ORF1 [Yushu Rhabd tick virus 2]